MERSMGFHKDSPWKQLTFPIGQGGLHIKTMQKRTKGLREPLVTPYSVSLWSLSFIAFLAHVDKVSS